MDNINVFYYLLTEKAKCSDFSVYRILWQQRVPCKKDMIVFLCVRRGKGKAPKQ